MKLMRSSPAMSLLSCALVAACGVAAAEQGSEWPLEISTAKANVVLYQPQPESLKDDRMTARAAVSVEEPGDTEPQFGAVWLDARISTDRDARLVTILDVEVPEVRFPNATPAKQKEIAEILQTELPKSRHTCPLDALLTTLDQADLRTHATDGIVNAPPKIVFATVPTVLITIDGKPQMQPVERTALMRVVNTPFVILFDPSTKSWFLRAGERWVQAQDYLGPWVDAPHPPDAVASALPAPKYENTSDAPPAAERNKSAAILVVTEPTELVVSDGEPKWTPVEGNELLYLANSDSDVFMEVGTQQYFVLLAGRWYRSTSLIKGAWVYVPADKLPAAFAKIPPGSEHGDVRAFVAGTDEARDAVLDASIPQTSVVLRKDAQCHVTYDGDPKFDLVGGTQMRYALNASDPVIAVDGAFYCCEQGVWFTSTQPIGPWSVCTSVPDAVHTIPPSCPAYPASYVYVYDATPEYVHVGYLPGYTGCYVYGPTIVYGTGWWYPGWYGSVYYPHPWTWGFGAFYDPWVCGWNYGVGFGWGVSPGWFSLSFGWGHPGWWGPSGFHCDHFDIHGHVVQFHPPPPHVPIARWHPGLVQTHFGHENIYHRPENAARHLDLTHSGGPAAMRMHSPISAAPNNVFADAEGRVLRHNNGAWEEHHADGWKPTDRVRAADASSPSARVHPPAAPAPSRENARPYTPPPAPRSEPPGGERGARGARGERPVVVPPAPPPARDAPRFEPRPQRDDFERINRAREQGSQRASGFQQRAGSRPGGRSGPGRP